MKQTLSDAFIRSLKPADRQYEVFDKLVSQFAVRVSPGGKKSFNFVYRYRGKSRRLTLGSYPDITLAYARELVRAAKKRLAGGEDPQAAKRADRDQFASLQYVTVVRQYIEIYAKRETVDWRETERILLRREIRGPWQFRAVNTLTGVDVSEVLDTITPCGPSAKSHAFATIRKFFNWCKKRGCVASNPCDTVDYRVKFRERSRVLDDWELADVAVAADEMGGVFGAFVSALILTGQRRAEVAALRANDIDLLAKSWAQTKNKSNREHTVYLSDEALEIFRRRMGIGDEFLFQARGKTKPISGFSKWKIELDRRSGVSNWCLHDLRRTVATRMSETGVAIHIIELVLNHRATELKGVAGIYNRNRFEREQRAALSDWGRFVRSLVEKKRSDRLNVVRIASDANGINTVCSSASV